MGCGADIKYKMNYNICSSCRKSASATVVSYGQNKQNPVNGNLSQDPVQHQLDGNRIIFHSSEGHLCLMIQSCVKEVWYLPLICRTHAS